MRRKVFFIISISLIVTIIITAVVFAYLYLQTLSKHFFTDEPHEICNLYVNNSEMPDEVIIKTTYVRRRVYDRFPILEKTVHIGFPFVKVIEELGGRVFWVDDNIAEITYADEKYILTLSEITLTKIGDENYNYICNIGGTKYCEVLDREILVDHGTLSCILSLMRIKVQFHLCSEEGYVSINSLE